MTDLLYHKIQTALEECKTHISRIQSAVIHLKPIVPLSSEKLAALTEQQIAWLDQFIYRFTKLQDAIGARLLPALAVLVIGNDEPRPFLDTLNQLEKTGVLKSVEIWQTLRVLRNNLAHDYPDGMEQCAETLNVLFADWEQMSDIFLTARDYFNNRLLPLIRSE